MKKELILTFTFLLLISTVLMAQIPEWQWAAQAGGIEYDCGRAIAIDEYGNTYVTGFFSDTATFGSNSLTSNGNNDIFIAKMDANGNWLWAVNAGGNFSDCGQAIAIDDSGSIYVTGTFYLTSIFGSNSLTSNGNEDIFVAKLDANGNWLWATSAGGSGFDYGLAITVDENGDSYLTGRFQYTSFFGSNSLTSNGSSDMYIAKLNVNGNWIWATNAGGNNSESASGIAIDDSGSTYVTGYFSDTATFGSYTLTSNGNEDIFVTKLDVNGNWIWATNAGGNNSESTSGIAIDDSGNCYVTGAFSGTDTSIFGSNTLISSGSSDIFVAKLDANCNWLWASKAGSSDGDAGLALAIDGYANMFITGNFRSTATFGPFSLTSHGSEDMFVAKMDTNGNWLWVKQTGGNSYDCCYAIAIDDDDNSYVTGRFQGTVSFGSYSFTCFSYWSDIFVAKLGNETSVNNEIIPMKIKLSNYPNPFNPSTTIEFSVYRDSKVDISIYNIKGQKIKTLIHNDYAKGNYSIIWDSVDESGISVSSGIYYYKLNVNGKTEAVKKCLLLK